MRKGKGDKDRMTVLPKSLLKEITGHIERARALWEQDVREGKAGVYIPGALARKFRNASETFEWFWLFPAKQLSIDPDRVKGFASRDFIQSGHWRRVKPEARSPQRRKDWTVATAAGRRGPRDFRWCFS